MLTNTTANVRGLQGGIVERTVSRAEAYPPAYLEYILYGMLFYAMLGGVWGIIIPALGGAIWVTLAARCFLNIGMNRLSVYKPITWALCTGVLFIGIGYIFHEAGERAKVEAMAFLSWLCLLITVQSLSLRPGFLHRFALGALAIGLASLPYIALRGSEGHARAFATGTGLSNGNVLGMWFGFCTVYLVFWGFRQQSLLLRTGSWATALGCLYIVAITVSRAPLIAIVLACVVGFRSELKRGFVPLLALVLLISLVYISGVFDTQIDYYAARATDKSGRDKLWPAAMERILDSPLIGVGLDHISIKLGEHYVMPHNGPLHIALGAGILPLICFLFYVGSATSGALRIMRKSNLGDAAMLPPLVVYAVVEVMVLDATFMSPWTVVVLGMAASVSQVKTGERRIVP